VGNRKKNTPKGHSVIGSRFVLQNKYGTNGVLEKRKARVVARGFSQQPERDFQETYAPISRLNTIRLALAVAAHRKMHIRQYDVTTAYLNGTLEEEVFMEAPKMMEETLQYMIERKRMDHQLADMVKTTLKRLRAGDVVCHMRKALYSLKQAGRAWHKRLDEKLRRLNAFPKQDPCLYLKNKGEKLMIIVVYVDDILIMSSNLREIVRFGENLGKTFDVRDLGNPKRCFGIDFTIDEDGIKFSQETYVRDILQRFGMEESNPVSTPLIQV